MFRVNAQGHVSDKNEALASLVQISGIGVVLVLVWATRPAKIQFLPRAMPKRPMPQAIVFVTGNAKKLEEANRGEKDK